MVDRFIRIVRAVRVTEVIRGIANIRVIGARTHTHTHPATIWLNCIDSCFRFCMKEGHKVNQVH